MASLKFSALTRLLIFLLFLFVEWDILVRGCATDICGLFRHAFGGTRACLHVLASHI